MLTSWPKLKYSKIFLLLLLVGLPQMSSAQKGFWYFENHAYYDPIKAEPRAANIKVLPLAYSTEFEFMQKKGNRFMWDIQLGKEIPIIGYAKSFQEDPYPAPGKWGMGLWIPVSFHTTLDHKDPSSPIINTDYRFKFTGKAMYGSKDAADTYWGAMLTIWAHESTHLGDEFSLAAQFNSPDEFRRVNVSWEFWEFGASYFKIRQNSDELTFRVGTRGLWTVKPFALRGDNSFYSVDPREANFRQVTLSKRSIESFYGQFQYVFVNDGKRWFPFVSIDARMRVIYDYDRPSANAKEDYGFGLNMLLGLITNRDISERGRVDPYFRFYYGVNPNGQFRNQSDFWLVGLGLGVDL